MSNENVESKFKLRIEELESKIKEMNTFIYKAHHDLRAPLASLMGLINLSRKDTHGEKTHNYLELIEESAHKMDGILAGLMQVLNHTPSSIVLEAVDIKGVIKNILKSIEHMPEAKGVQFNVQTELDREFTSDKKMLDSILQNLIVNAITYKTQLEVAKVEIWAKTDDTGLKIMVSDNGIGIPDDLQEKIFEIFFRGTDTSKGTGLGLYLVKSFVEKLGGRVELISSKGAGSAFILYFPIQTQPVQNTPIAVCHQQQPAT